MSAVTRETIKGLFFHLVRAVGGVEAAAAYLDISHQRVSRLQLIRDGSGEPVQDMPTVLQIVTLEAVVGQPVVTGALARSAEGKSATADPIKEAGDVVIAASEVFSAVRSGATRKDALAVALRAQRELDELKDSLGAPDDAA